MEFVVFLCNLLSLKFVPNGSIINEPSLMQIMAWSRTGNHYMNQLMFSLLSRVYIEPRWGKRSHVTYFNHILPTPSSGYRNPHYEPSRGSNDRLVITTPYDRYHYGHPQTNKTMWIEARDYCGNSTGNVTNYNDVIMGEIASQITSPTIVYSAVYTGADQRKHQSSAPLAFVRGIHRSWWISRKNGQLRGKCFHLMALSWSLTNMAEIERYDNAWNISVILKMYKYLCSPFTLCWCVNRTPNCYGKTWRLLCPFFRNLHLRENLARDCFTSTASTVTNSVQNISLPVYGIVTNTRLQPLTTTFYNSMLVSFSLLKV